MTSFMKALVILLLPAVRLAADASDDPPCPFDLVQLQPVLKQCRLQCPSTSRPIVSDGKFENFSMPGNFFVDNSTMVLSMNYHRGGRCELRHDEEWSTAAKDDTSFQYKAVMKVVPENDSAFTIMQIHSKSFTGTDGHRYLKGPPLMVGRGDRGNLKDHLWAYVRVSLEPKKVTAFDLGPRPQDFFELHVLLENGDIVISLDGDVKVRQDIRHWDPLPRNYFKTGMYAHGPGTQSVQYKELEMGSIKKRSSTAIQMATPTETPSSMPTSAPTTAVPTETPTYEPTETPTPRPTSMPTATPTSTPTAAPTSTPTAAPTTTPTLMPTAAPTTAPTAMPNVPPATETSIGLVSVEPQPVPQVTRLVLVDAEKNQELFELTDGYVLDKSKLTSFSIVAIVESERVERVTFAVDGKLVKTEKHEPYAIAGDKDGGNINPWSIDLGQHVITTTPYLERLDERHGRFRRRHSTMKGKSLSLTITVVSGENAAPSKELPRVVHLMLVDGHTGDDLFSLADGNFVDTSVLPAFAIRAVTNPTKVGSVLFFVNGEMVKTENFEPYAIASDARDRNYHQWFVLPGAYSITAVPCTEENGRGMQGKPMSAVITVF